MSGSWSGSLAAFLLLCSAVVAPARGAPPTLQGTVKAETGSAAVVQSGFASPRETIELYLRAISAWRERRNQLDLDEAARCFDARQWSASEAGYAAQRAAQQLVDVLDRVEEVRPDEFGDAAAVADRTSVTYELRSAAHPDVRFPVAFVRDDLGRWLIARETSERITGWLTLTAGWERIANAGRRATLAETVRGTVPARFQRSAFWLEHWQWIGLAVLIGIGFALQALVRFLFRRFLERLGRADSIRLDRALLARFERPLAILVTSVVFVKGIALLDLAPGANSVLFIAGSTVIAFAGIWACYRLTDVVSSFFAERAAQTDNKFDDMLVPLLRRTLKIVVLVVGTVLLLSQVIGDEELWTLMAGLSIGSLAIGFAAKDSIENLFGTFTVLLDKPFQLGDYIRIGDVEGSVEDVGFRSTRVRTPEDSLISVPNSRFISATVDNLGARRYRRIRTLLALPYDTPPEKIEALCEGVKELIRATPAARQDNFEVALYQMSASSIDVLMQLYVLAPDFRTDVEQRHRILIDVVRLADRLGLSFAYPTTTVQVAPPGGAEHRDSPPDVPSAHARGREAARELRGE